MQNIHAADKMLLKETSYDEMRDEVAPLAVERQDGSHLDLNEITSILDQSILQGQTQNDAMVQMRKSLPKKSQLKKPQMFLNDLTSITHKTETQSKLESIISDIDFLQKSLLEKSQSKEIGMKLQSMKQ